MSRRRRSASTTPRASSQALQRKFTNIVGPETRDICYATQNRQSAVRDLSKLVDVILVVGATNSSNSNRLREIGEESGLPSYLIADGSELNPKWLEGVKAVGLTAGASAPEVLVEDVIDSIAASGAGRGLDHGRPPGENRIPAARGTRGSVLAICARLTGSNSKKVSEWEFRS